MKEGFAAVAAILAVVGNLPYVWDIFKGRVRPHPYTWFIWSIVSGIVFFGQIAKGAGIGALPTAASEIFTVIIFLFSLKYGFSGATRMDTVFLGLALMGVVLWPLTGDPTLSVIIAVIIDLFAFGPTIRKTWANPSSETPVLFSTNVVRHIFALASLQSYNIATTLHSISMILTNTTMTAIILFRRRY